MQKFLSSKGFTLIELLVTIAVIGILAGGTIAAVDPLAQFKKARDAQKMADLKILDTALEAYYNDYGTYPPVSGSGSSCSYATKPGVNTDFIPGLVEGKYIKNTPVPPSEYYCYYRYPAGYAEGALLRTKLEAMPDMMDTSKKYPATCRSSVLGTCKDTVLSKEYCLCNPF